MKKHETNGRRAIPCDRCGRRSMGPAHILNSVDHGLLDELRTVIGFGAPQTKIDKLLPKLLAAMEGYERENEWLSNELDGVDVDSSKAANESHRDSLRAGMLLEDARIAYWLRERYAPTRTTPLASFTHGIAVTAALGFSEDIENGLHWEPLKGEPADERERTEWFARKVGASLLKKGATK